MLAEPVEGKYEAMTTPLPPVTVTASAPPPSGKNAKVIAVLAAVGTIIGALLKFLSEN